MGSSKKPPLLRRLAGGEIALGAGAGASSTAFGVGGAVSAGSCLSGQRDFVGECGGLATTNRHVTFESCCERDYLIEFDFDPEIVGVAAQHPHLPVDRP
ncbi:MAG: hypothetical protein QOI30_948 [Mycobacterium sp.]|jgi:hypothetical protein|nr:hypothetical protein [Mycobacterium sp.]MDT7767952.1 hypothetical protein [Mycobacterium sp.]